MNDLIFYQYQLLKRVSIFNIIRFLIFIPFAFAINYYLKINVSIFGLSFILFMQLSYNFNILSFETIYFDPLSIILIKSNAFKIYLHTLFSYIFSFLMAPLILAVVVVFIFYNNIPINLFLIISCYLNSIIFLFTMVYASRRIAFYGILLKNIIPPISLLIYMVIIFNARKIPMFILSDTKSFWVKLNDSSLIVIIISFTLVNLITSFLFFKYIKTNHPFIQDSVLNKFRSKWY